MSKKKLIALTTLACGSMVSLSADQAAKGTNQAASSDNKMNYVITPSAQPVVEGDADFFFTADFIWWKPNQEGTSVAFPGFANGSNAPSGKVVSPNFSFEPGFKFGFGTTMKHDTWDLYVNWTWLRSQSNSAHRHTHTNETMWSDLNFSDAGTSVPSLWAMSDVHTHWNMHFNVIDLELGRNFWISKCLTLRPHIGLKTAWIHQSQQVRYEDIASSGGGALSGNDAKVKMHQHYWGLGLRTGLNTSWHFDRNWSLYGDFALSALWTDYDDSRKDTFTTTSTSLRTYNGKNDVHTIEPVLEIGLGLMYQTWWHNDDYQFTIAAGWEEQVWFDHNQHININAHRQGNFTLQGLTVKVGFEF